MIQRCNNPNVNNYINYGGRGITVCQSWGKFENFLSDMGLPKENDSIERIDNSKGYSKANCCWINKKLQAKNKRNNIRLTANGKTYLMAEWAEITGINIQTLYARYKKGWNHNKIVNKPVKGKAGL